MIKAKFKKVDDFWFAIVPLTAKPGDIAEVSYSGGTKVVMLTDEVDWEVVKGKYLASFFDPNSPSRNRVIPGPGADFKLPPMPRQIDCLHGGHCSSYGSGESCGGEDCDGVGGVGALDLG